MIYENNDPSAKYINLKKNLTIRASASFFIKVYHHCNYPQVIKTRMKYKMMWITLMIRPTKPTSDLVNSNFKKQAPDNYSRNTTFNDFMFGFLRFEKHLRFVGHG